MYESDLNIKHYNRSHLFWGIDKETNEVVYIDEIENRGLDCNCRCAQCKGDFIARLGDIKRHHFAHKSNYECLYANEIAFYLRVLRWLKQNNLMRVPPVFFEFGNHTDTASKEKDVQIGEVFYHCEASQYPPLLMAETEQRPIRIVLGFGTYYSIEDKVQLREEAIRKNWDCLMINLPKIIDRDPLPGSQLEDRLKMWSNTKEWIYCSESDNARNRLETISVVPKPVFEDRCSGYVECPIHSQFLDGKYCARSCDCDGCRYNLAKSPKCMCLAHEGVSKYSDLELPIKIRKANVDSTRDVNDAEHRLRALGNQSATYYSPAGHAVSKAEVPKVDILTKDSTSQKNIGSNLRPDGTVNTMGFNPDIPIETDRFGRHWVQCKKCHRVLTTGECYDYDKLCKSSYGTCRACVRKANVSAQ